MLRPGDDGSMLRPGDDGSLLLGGSGRGFCGEHFSFTIQVFFGDDGAHGALGDLAFYPGDEVEVGEGAGFIAVAFEAADLFEEFFKFGAQA